MGAVASQITSLTIVYSTVYSGADQRKYQSSASLAFLWGINRGQVKSQDKWPVTRKMFSFDDVIMCKLALNWTHLMIIQHWFREWLGAVRQPAITWANIDPAVCRHMASPGHNGFSKTTTKILRSITLLLIVSTYWQIMEASLPLSILTFTTVGQLGNRL